MNIQLVPQALEIIERYATDKENDDYLFPVLDKELHKLPKTIFNRIEKVSKEINKNLKILAKKANITTPLST